VTAPAAGPAAMPGEVDQGAVSGRVGRAGRVGSGYGLGGWPALAPGADLPPRTPAPGRRCRPLPGPRGVVAGGRWGVMHPPDEVRGVPARASAGRHANTTGGPRAR